MRQFDIPQDGTYPRNVIDWVSYWLHSQRQPVIWLFVICVPVAVLTVDVMTSGRNLHTEFLYAIPIALVCWMFRLRKAVLATSALLIISTIAYPLSRDAADLSVILGDIGMRVGTFALLAVIVICYRQVFDKAQSLATHDRMTGILNKVTFNERTAKMLTRSRSDNQVLLLLLLDLDGFKAINDHHGHFAGDLVLQEFSRQASVELRPNDCFGRLGGDEFGVALTVASIDLAQHLAEALQQRFVAILARGSYVVTCSIGGVIVPPTSTLSWQDLIVEADRLMYAAKGKGKNCIKLAVADQAMRNQLTPPPLAPSLDDVANKPASQTIRLD